MGMVIEHDARSGPAVRWMIVDDDSRCVLLPTLTLFPTVKQEKMLIEQVDNDINIPPDLTDRVRQTQTGSLAGQSGLRASVARRSCTQCRV
jgi:hypothetical protein